MLYVTTRSSRDAYTVRRALYEAAAPDGGLYVPFRLVPMEQAQISGLLEQGFARCTAELLNIFFSTRLTAWDVDFCVGKNLCNISVMNHRIAIGELWHNQQRDFAWLVSRLSDRIKEETGENLSPDAWFGLAVRIGAIFGVFSELHRSGILEKGQQLDIAVAADDFSQAVAAWYARYLGLPIGTILCAASQRSCTWDLMNYGQMRTDAVPVNLERLIFLALGQDEATHFADVSRAGRPYSLTASQAEALRGGLFSAVVGPRRIKDIIPSVFNTNGYLLDPDSAQAYGGIQDYRAQAGEIRPTLILAEKCPSRRADDVAKAMGMTAGQLKQKFRFD